MSEPLHPQTLEEIARRIAKALPDEAVVETPVPGLSLYRRHRADLIDCTPGQVFVSLIAQGAKESTIGGRVYEYRAGQCLVSGLSTPASYHAVAPSPAKPFLSASLKLDVQTLIDFSMTAELPAPAASIESGAFVFDADEEIGQAFLRLVRLLEHPEQIPHRAPLIEKDLHYLLLISPCGASLHSLASAGTQSHAVMKAVSWIKRNYARSFRIEELADYAHMSSSTFHRQFKAITGLSPLQFQKQVRLYEAQHLMVAEGARVASAAYAVGYESSTQFVREYKRLFGNSPLRDVKNRLAAAGLAAGMPPAAAAGAADPAAAQAAHA